jgi:hypothetical protein
VREPVKRSESKLLREPSWLNESIEEREPLSANESRRAREPLELNEPCTGENHNCGVSYAAAVYHYERTSHFGKENHCP